MDHDDLPKHKSGEQGFGTHENRGQTYEGLSSRRGIHLAIGRQAGTTNVGEVLHSCR